MASSTMMRPFFAGIDVNNRISNDPTSFTATVDCYAVVTHSNFGGDMHLYLDDVEIAGVYYGTTTVSSAVFIVPIRAGQTIRKTGAGMHMAIYGLL